MGNYDSQLVSGHVTGGLNDAWAGRLSFKVVATMATPTTRCTIAILMTGSLGKFELNCYISLATASGKPAWLLTTARSYERFEFGCYQ